MPSSYFFRSLMPGLVPCLIVAALAVAVNLAVPALSPLLLAIVLGAVLTNVVSIPESWSAGVQFSSKKLLRVGIVLLGLQLAIGDILSLGWRVIVGVVAVVTLSLLGTLAMARMLGISRPLSILIACGFSICGAAAIAGVEDIADADEEEVATAIALVVLFGTLMIPLAPLAASAMGMSEIAGGTWIGASTHEVAQVVAAGGAFGATALSVAVIVKLTRVVLLAPVAVAFSLAARSRGTLHEGAKRPPIVPLFVIGFLAMIGIGSLEVIPADVLSGIKMLQTGLLAAAMFALGLGVRIKGLVRVGGRPVLLGALSTVWIALLALTMVVVSGTIVA
ncbi:YeiH family protein [Dermabacter hominis]|uniref:YeiH family protein n=1 Tax=Dermabacter hominis TaxID=36740 RepID=UPI0021AED9F0|nr:putative sulfate exporter family transporter [Dermabacter hominis]MCT2024484.1 putative sulfate exporter family transporter [Dermabacter hominis]